MKILTNVALMVVTLVMVATFQANAAGLGKSYIATGDISVTVLSNPHKNFSGEWGIVDPEDGLEVGLGWTDEVGTPRYVGQFNGDELIFWADGKRKRFYTGHGNSSTSCQSFVINGVKFAITADEYAVETPIIEETETVSEVIANDTLSDDCSDPDIVYSAVNVYYLQSWYVSRLNLDILRIRMVGNAINWNLFKEGDVTAEVTLNNQCENTWNLSDTIHKFEKTSKRYKGVKLDDYDYPGGKGMYPAKIRVVDEAGKKRHYLYVNNVNVAHLVGSNVNVKIRLYQGGQIIQAYEGDAKMGETIK